MYPKYGLTSLCDQVGPTVTSQYLLKISYNCNEVNATLNYQLVKPAH